LHDIRILDIDGCLHHEVFFKKNILEQTADHTGGLLKFGGKHGITEEDADKVIQILST